MTSEARTPAQLAELPTFDPDWCIAPADTLREWMEANSMPVIALAVAAGGRDKKWGYSTDIQEVLDRKPLRDHHALILARGTGIPERMWLALEHNYRVALAAGKKDVSE